MPDQIGPYLLIRRIGAGGMGQVYLARDTRLGRSVAIKLLTEAASPELLERFRREGRTVASLKHPHIAVLHDVGDHGGVPYLVMEWVEGVTLAERLRTGPMAWPECLEMGLALASALRHAHERGILHRDIKPANIMLDPARGPMLLDFGLALQHVEDTGSSPNGEPTIARLSRTGYAVGTALYMSPEQLVGQVLDNRSDLFQLGLVLYEAVSGRHPFKRETLVDTQHAILHAPPAPLEPGSQVPPDYERILHKLLEKDREYRYPDARALEVDLKGLRRSSSGGASSHLSVPMLQAESVRSRRRARIAWTAAAGVAVLALAAAAGLWLVRDGASPAAPSRVYPVTHGDSDDGSPSFSPDGKSIVYSSTSPSGSVDLWVRLVSGGEPVQVTDSPESELHPDWSPDGSRVAFTRMRADGGPDVYVMPALGGRATRVARDALQPAWSPDGKSLAVALPTPKGIRVGVVPSDGSGPPRPLTESVPGYYESSPAWTPDGRQIVFARSGGGTVAQIFRVSVAGGAAVALTRDPPGTRNRDPVVTPDGRAVLHVSDRGGQMNLWRVPLEDGEPERVTSGTLSEFDPDVSPDGRRIAYAAVPEGARLVVRDMATGSEDTVARLPGSYAWRPQAVASGDRIFFSLKRTAEPWVVASCSPEDRTVRTWFRIEGHLIQPVPSPDGRHVYFFLWAPGRQRVGRGTLDGGEIQWVSPEDQDCGYPDLSRDGRWLAYVCFTSKEPEIRVQPAGDGAGEARVVARGAETPIFSPDGRTLAVARSRVAWSGGIGVVPATGGPVRWLTESGAFPTWTPDGSRIAYTDTGPLGAQIARQVDPATGEVFPVSGVSWNGTNYPFSFDARGRIWTTRGLGEPAKIWIAEF